MFTRRFPGISRSSRGVHRLLRRRDRGVCLEVFTLRDVDILLRNEFRARLLHVEKTLIGDVGDRVRGLSAIQFLMRAVGGGLVLLDLLLELGYFQDGEELTLPDVSAPIDIASNCCVTEQAQKALDLAQSRYKLGLSSIVELSQAQLNETQAEIAQASAKYDYQTQTSILNQFGALH